MFKNREYAGRMIGSAAVGVAVGMLVQKILSPRSSEKPASVSDTASTIRFEYVQEPSRTNNLQIPSYCQKHRRQRGYQFRSKSESGAEDSREECSCLSVSPYSLQKSKLSASESDLRLYSETDSDMSKSNNYEKVETIKNTVGMASDSDNESRDTNEVFLNTLTEYLPSKSKGSRNSCDTLQKDYNLDSFRESFAKKSTKYLSHKLKDVKNLRDTADYCNLNSHSESSVSKSTEHLPFKSKDQENLSDASENHNLKSDHETCTSKSTEYLPFKLKDGKYLCDTANKCNLKSYRKNVTSKSTECLSGKMKNKSKASEQVPLLLFDISGKKSKTKNCSFTSSIGNRAKDEISNCSIVATCDTVERDCNFNSYCKDHTKIVTEMEDISTPEFVTLPTFYGSKVLSSVIGNESLQ